MDDEDFDFGESPELFVNFSSTFKVVRVLDKRLVPTTFSLKADVIFDDDRDGSDPDYIFRTQVAFAKIRYWLNNIVQNSVMFSRDNKWAGRAFLNSRGKQSVTNHMIVLPGEPSEDLLAEVFQSKLNALADCALTFGCIEVCSDEGDGLTFIFTGEGEMNLPEMDEWVGEFTYFSKPWWARNDASTLDVIPDEGTDINNPPAFAYSLDFLGDTMRAKNAPTARIVRPEFRPKVIQGGCDG
jgi:hypothetical protein